MKVNYEILDPSVAPEWDEVEPPQVAPKRRAAPLMAGSAF